MGRGEGERRSPEPILGFSQGKVPSSPSLSSSVFSQPKGFELSRRARRRARHKLGSSIELSRQTLAIVEPHSLSSSSSSSLSSSSAFPCPCSNSCSKHRHHFSPPPNACFGLSLSFDSDSSTSRCPRVQFSIPLTDFPISLHITLR